MGSTQNLSDDSDYVLSRTRNQIITETTDAYIEQLDLDNPPSPEEIEQELLSLIKQEFDLENQMRSKGAKMKPPETLNSWQIAKLMSLLYPIAKIACAGSNSDPEYDLLAIYKEDGPDEGTYVTSEETMFKLALRFNVSMSTKEFNEVVAKLRLLVPRKTRCTDRDMIAVNNGIFDFEKKILEPFSPDIVFMTKSHVNYNPAATNVVIHNDDDGTDWDIESWMNDLSDDPEIVELLWEILSAIIRPHVRWNKSAWLYSESGNNGKGTLCELMRSLCGDTAYASIPLNSFSKDFALEPLTRATAVIVDENDVGDFIDKAANLKAVITNDVIAINRKFKTPISYQFYGFMVQCLNEFPRIKDKSDSFYRRQLFIPFTKCFTGKERKYIKNDYLHRDEVLEYVLYRVLHMNFYTLSEPQACLDVLNEYKEFNDPVRQFFEEMEDFFQWDLLPFSFLYELYKQWFRKNSPNGSIQGKTKFINELLNVVQGNQTWYCSDKTKNIRSAGKMELPEPLIATYDVMDWKNPSYNGPDPNKIGLPHKNAFYRGLLRYDSTNSNIDEDNNVISTTTDESEVPV